MIFNSQIRNMVQTVKYRNGRRVQPNAARRAEGFKQLRVAMKVSFEIKYASRHEGESSAVTPHHPEVSRSKLVHAPTLEPGMDCMSSPAEPI